MLWNRLVRCNGLQHQVAAAQRAAGGVGKSRWLTTVPRSPSSISPAELHQICGRPESGPLLLDRSLRHSYDQEDNPQGDDPLPPAARKWFSGDGLSPYMRSFLAMPFSYELTVSHETSLPSILKFHARILQSPDALVKAAREALERAIAEAAPTLTHASDSRLCQFEAPLALFHEALEYNHSAANVLAHLYIAQSSISDLSAPLQDDLPIPRVIGGLDAAAGSTDDDDRLHQVDVYNTSIWLGLTPTFTPWHRDPNPNFFQQLWGSKLVRLTPPDEGREVFRRTQASLRCDPGGTNNANPNIRTVSMFEGAERTAWHEAIWGPQADRELSDMGLTEALLHPGDSLFIPQGWWHSVKSDSKADGQLNASANWWFRWRQRRK